MTDISDNNGEPTARKVVIDQESGEAYRPGELIVLSEHLLQLRERADLAGFEIVETNTISYAALGEILGDPVPPDRTTVLVSGEPSKAVDDFVRQIAADGAIDAALNTVFFADACHLLQCPPHPAYANPAYANPAYANPAYANPAYANPAYANPAYANPAYANWMRRNGALPARAVIPRTTNPTFSTGESEPAVILLDTGLADDVYIGQHPLVNTATVLSASGLQTRDEPDSIGDGELDPVAGHGTFIAGLIELACPGVDMTLPKVIEPTGVADLGTILALLSDSISSVLSLGQGLTGLPQPSRGVIQARLARILVGMSFSGRLMDSSMRGIRRDLKTLARTGVVFVASVGNEGSCERTYPAAFGDPTADDALVNVVAVGALGHCGPAPFTNYGPWVRACAAGEALTSSFFQYEEAAGPQRSFDGWALWSGTSFSVPVVIGALLREMRLTGSTASDAVERLVDAPGLPGIHNLGTIVA